MILDLPYNFHWVVPDEAARSAQAYAGFLGPFLQAHGIRTLINLRGSNPRHLWWRYETRACARAGVLHCDARFNSRQLPAGAMLLDLLNTFDMAPRPLLIKCSGGQDRTSFAAAIYLLHVHGWQAMPHAARQFARWPYLHFPNRQQRWLRLFPVFAAEQAGAGPLRNWIGGAYSAEAFRIWLEQRGEGASFHGLYGVPGNAPKR